MSLTLSPLIHLIDDDAAVREGLALLIGTVGLRVTTWSEPQAFLDGFDREAIGAIGRTGRATTAHLHFEVQKNGKAINPMPYLKQGLTQVVSNDSLNHKLALAENNSTQQKAEPVSGRTKARAKKSL